MPVVFAQGLDPVGAGFVESLARPGGNATGFTQFEYSLSGKWLEMLKEVAPGLTRAGVLREGGPAGIGQWAIIQAVAQSSGVELSPINLRDASETERAVTAFAGSPNGGLIVIVSASSQIHRELIISLAARHQLPVVYPYRFFVTSGGLMSYGPDLINQYRRAAGYVDRILKGEKPSDLPVQTATKFELTINLKTAKALGLKIPPTLLARADEVIDDEASRVHHAARRHDGDVAARGARAAGRAGAAHWRADALAADDKEAQARISAFVQGLKELGWTEGRNVQIESGLGRDNATLRKHAAEMVALAPDVILASGSATTGPLLQVTHTVPIVFVIVPDPVGAGFVASLARPGGNATGFTPFEFGIGAKWLELLKEVMPSMTRVAVIRDPGIPSGLGQFAAIQAVAPSLGVDVTPVNVRDPKEIERDITAFARYPNGGLIVTGAHWRQLIAI